MHVSYELRHDDVDVLAQQLMRRITNDLTDFPIAVFDDADVASFSGDDDYSTDRVISIFLLLYVTLHLHGLSESPLGSLNGLLIALIGLV